MVASACSSQGEALDESGDELNQTSDSKLDAEFASRTPCKKASASDRTCLGESEVAAVVRTAGFPESIIATMVCTARVESGFRTNISNKNSDQSTDRGLFQVNSVHIGDPVVNPTRAITQGCPSTAQGLFDSAANARCALAVYNGQQRGNSDPKYGIAKAWYAYRRYKKQCDRFQLSESSVAATDRSANDDPGEGALPLPIPDPTPTPPKSPTTEASGEPGSCFAGTLQSSLPPGGCYQRSGDGVWFQCNGGQWFRGVDGDGQTGPYGACEPRFPLQ
jgi:hypothetical protein